MPSEEYYRASSIQDLVERELASCNRAYDAGVLPALYEAFEVCRRHDHPTQPWMVDVMPRVLEMLLAGGLPRRRGRAGNPMAEFISDQKDFYRWDTVKEVRRYQKDFWEEQKELLELNLTEEQWRNIKANKVNPGRTWEDAYICASDTLARTVSFGSPATMKRSYQKVERALKDPIQAPRFKVLSHRTLGRLGVKFDKDSLPPKSNRVKK